MPRPQFSPARLLLTPVAFGAMLGFLRPTIAEAWIYAITAAVGLSGIGLVASQKMIVPIVVEFAGGLLAAHACVVLRWPTLIASHHGDYTNEMNISNTLFGAIAGWSMAVVVVRAVPWVLHAAFHVRSNNTESPVDPNLQSPPPAGSTSGPQVE